MPAPTFDPDHRPRTGTPPPEDYQSGERVWVYRAGAWRPGVVLHSSPKAVTVRYRPAEGRGTGVDTVTSHSLAPREDDDPYLDLAPAGELGSGRAFEAPVAPMHVSSLVA